MKTSQLGEGELPEVRARDQLTCTAAIPVPKKNTNVLSRPFWWTRSCKHISLLSSICFSKAAHRQNTGTVLFHGSPPLPEDHRWERRRRLTFHISLTQRGFSPIDLFQPPRSERNKQQTHSLSSVFASAAGIQHAEQNNLDVYSHRTTPLAHQESWVFLLEDTWQEQERRFACIQHLASPRSWAHMAADVRWDSPHSSVQWWLL